tara:strand:- start:1232 stop:1408 length:177 start_codon:yes stop_codon:yes gene_type:complete
MNEKTYDVKIIYEGTITCKAEDAEELEAALWVTHKLFGKPFDEVLLDAEHVEIEEVEE